MLHSLLESLLSNLFSDVSQNELCNSINSDYLYSARSYFSVRYMAIHRSRARVKESVVYEHRVGG